jgi:hypothetical protein
MPTDEELRELAVQSLKRKRGFMKHLRSYIVVNAFLWALYVWAGISSHEWAPWPLIVMGGWGIGLGLNAWAVYGRGSGPITEDEIQRQIQKQKGAGAP